ncbi:putative ubiquitin activating enzyme (E1) subunit Aos1 [Plasmodium gaboni]|uniref:Putative ubiquitin activating enzyme (E1) subunit Aos1 n=1 Tax=Plasmodium gaboni TaxID=647221 RepID=A0A151LJB3_9APIC|nr:putative ubiquitin activating enzyme (E1) subunit Aos1 [Plasmodium gaboni]KYN99078.1 putative ubiquitin activating enzyme (E1) subunit Aos1 [Plasmodium gaboni]
MEKEKIYDRQLRLWGVKAQNRMMKSNVLVVGLSGINIELCKNLILNGINITIIDNNIVDEEDIENIFFLNEYDDMNEYMSVAIYKELKSINQLINIKGYIGHIDLDKNNIIIEKELIYKDNEIIKENKKEEDCSYNICDYITNYTCVCISCEDYPLYKLTKINEICHEKNIGFFANMCHGKYAFLFSDFGNHIIEESYYKIKNDDNKKKCNDKNIQVQYCTLSHFLKVPFSNLDKKTNEIIYYVFALILYEQDKNINKQNKQIDEKDFLKFYNKLANKTYIQNPTELCKTYKINFSPSCSIMGGVTSQEIRKFISRQHESIPNFCVFDMNQNIVCTSMIK